MLAELHEMGLGETVTMDAAAAQEFVAMKAMGQAMSPVNILKAALETLADESMSPEERFDLAEFMFSTGEQVDFPTFHKFCGGQYIREVFYPAGAFLTGVEWVQEYPFILLKGKICIAWIEGGKLFSNTFEGPTYTVSKPHTRRLGFVLEDTSGLMVLRTDETTLDGIFESEAVAKRKNPLLDPDFEPLWKRANKEGVVLL